MKIINISAFIAIVSCSMDIYVSSVTMSTSSEISSVANSSASSSVANSSASSSVANSSASSSVANNALLEQMKSDIVVSAAQKIAQGPKYPELSSIDKLYAAIVFKEPAVVAVNLETMNHPVLFYLPKDDTNTFLATQYELVGFWVNTSTGTALNARWCSHAEKARIEEQLRRQKELRTWDEQVWDYKK